MSLHEAIAVHGLGHFASKSIHSIVLAGLLAPLLVLGAAVWQEFLSRRDRRLLSAMNDQELSDIGICRGQIFDVARLGRP